MSEEPYLEHYGILRRSGRYPWGSGRSESTRHRSFLDITESMRKQGMTESEIARANGITTTQLRAARSIANNSLLQQDILTAQRLKDRGWSNVEIGRRMKRNESSVRALLAPGKKDKADALLTTANVLKKHVDEKKYIDIGGGVESQLGVTRTRLDNSVQVLREQGYVTHNIKVQQVGTGKFTNQKVLAVPGTTLSEVQQNRSQIKLMTAFTEDNGRSWSGIKPPLSINSRRLRVRYGDEGGKEADGVIFVRPGIKDLSIGANRYGQVRIAIDGTHYLKGMAVYRDDLPPGVDLVFNTNKPNTGRKKDAMKPISDDPDNPFGSIVRQIHDEHGNVTSAMNIVGSPTKEGSGVEGNWDTWSKNLPSQMLSKQSPDLARQQLSVTYDRRQREFNEITSLTNPTVRKDLLEKFADSTDSAAVHLKAASLPRQATKVLLPIPSMKPTEIYAPTMRNGERVALVRFPHGGTFEIPQLTVNNRNPEARRILGTAAKGRTHDSVGIHHSVAERLSGADFDGDTVLVIPNNKGVVKSTEALEKLKGFDPHVYKIPKGSPISVIDSDRKQQEMGKISNLVTDMTLKGASTEELSRAVRHSMVVIDSEKHELDFKQSEKDHGILALKERYQGGKNRGAATLISRARSDTHPDEKRARRQSEGGPVDPKTGKKVFVETGRMRPQTRTIIDPSTGRKTKVPTGKMIRVTQKSEKLVETSDARTLISDTNTRMEIIYASHSNRLKALANTARKEALRTKTRPYSPSAKKVYSHEVDSLTAKLNLAKKNAPLERQAQIMANTIVGQQRQAHPHMEKDEIKKVKQLALNEARARTGAKKTRIDITQQEWNAIQAGAITNHRLTEILRHADAESVKKLALPREQHKMSSSERLRAESMLASGYTQAEVADQLGVGLTTLKVGLTE